MIVTHDYHVGLTLATEKFKQFIVFNFLEFGMQRYIILYFQILAVLFYFSLGTPEGVAFLISVGAIYTQRDKIQAILHKAYILNN